LLTFNYYHTLSYDIKLLVKIAQFKPQTSKIQSISQLFTVNISTNSKWCRTSALLFYSLLVLHQWLFSRKCRMNLAEMIRDRDHIHLSHQHSDSPRTSDSGAVLEAKLLLVSMNILNTFEAYEIKLQSRIYKARNTTISNVYTRMRYSRKWHRQPSFQGR